MSSSKSQTWVFTDNLPQWNQGGRGRVFEAKLPVCQHTRHTKIQWIMSGDVTDANFAHMLQDV